MEIVKISAYAEGHYSEATYYEEVYIPKKDYDIAKDRIDSELSVYIYDLDGKHSECCCEIEIEELDDEYFLENELGTDDGESLYENLSYIFEDLNLDLNKSSDEAYAYIKNLDKPITVSYTIKESLVSQLDKFVMRLKESDC